VADLARAARARSGIVMSAQRKAHDTEQTSLATGPLAARLKERIAREGPLSVADYMQTCLADPSAGYYISRQPIGKEGDFVTSPEVSQIFGELLGLWSVAVWQSMGEPPSVIVAELGPGRGTWTADALRAWRSVPKFLKSVTFALVETSPVLRDAQQAMLRGAPVPLQWCDRIEDAPSGPLILIANEFIDALPVRQLVRRNGVWRERRVTIGRNGAFAFTEAEAIQDDELASAALGIDAPDGAILETRPAVKALLSALATRAGETPLAALIVDYGHDETSVGDTLQAVHRHRFADPLATPGEVDLTAHVDFAALKETAQALGLTTHGPMAQGAFLLKLGLEARRDRLLAQARPDQKEAILSGAARLADPRAMGLLFKVLALTSNGLAPPPPFGDI
jgi:NADH dehydrogenase [ubiquinone] 1 alpha subcomplex assembly factor 7